MIITNAARSLLLFILLLLCEPVYLLSSNISQFHNSISQKIQSFDKAAINPEAIFEADFCTKSCKKSKKKKNQLSYYLYVEDFIASFIQIPTSNVLPDSSTVSSTYLAGRAPIYNTSNQKAGTCSASFLCIQNSENIFSNISNYLAIDNGLIVSWFTPTTLINLELDTIVHSMVTECIVLASTKIGFNPYYGQKFNMIVSSDSSKIYFNLYKMHSH